MSEEKVVDIIKSLIASIESQLQKNIDKYVESLLKADPSENYNKQSIKCSFKLKFLKSLLYTIDNKDDNDSITNVAERWYSDNFLSGNNRPFGLEDSTYLLLLNAKEDLMIELRFIKN